MAQGLNVSALKRNKSAGRSRRARYPAQALTLEDSLNSVRIELGLDIFQNYHQVQGVERSQAPDNRGHRFWGRKLRLDQTPALGLPGSTMVVGRTRQQGPNCLDRSTELRLDSSDARRLDWDI